VAPDEIIRSSIPSYPRIEFSPSHQKRVSQAVVIRDIELARVAPDDERRKVQFTYWVGGAYGRACLRILTARPRKMAPINGREKRKVQFTYWVGGLMVEPACASLPTDDERSTTCSIIPRSNISDREIEISEWLLFAVSE